MTVLIVLLTLLFAWVFVKSLDPVHDDWWRRGP
jgi:hypothetical protein